MAEREELVIRTFTEDRYLALQSGGRLVTEAGGYFVLGDSSMLPGVRITEYTLVRTRMDMPSLTAKLMYKRCLDHEWTGREYVDLLGERYWLRQTPSSRKTNTDERYEHELIFESERAVLGRVLFFDVASVPAGDDYKPRTNASDFSFYGSLREFVGRVNCALAYLGLADSIVTDGNVCPKAGIDTPMNDGYCVMVDEEGGYDLATEREISFEDQYIWDSLKAAFQTYGVPFAVRERKIIFGERDHIAERELAYGHDRELTGSGRTNRGEQIVNESTAYGSSENIPYYYPNDTPVGTIQLDCEGNSVLSVSDFEIIDADRLITKIDEGLRIVARHVDAADGYIQTTSANDSGMWYMNTWPENPERQWETHFMEDFVVSGEVKVSKVCHIPAYTDLVPGSNVATRKVKFRFSFYVNQLSEYRIKIRGAFYKPSGGTYHPVDITPEMSGITISGEEEEVVISKYYEGLRVTLHRGMHTLECDFYRGASAENFRLDSVEITGVEQSRNYWEYNGKEIRDMGKYGLVCSKVLTDDMAGDGVTWQTVENSRIPYQTRLTVPKYRRTRGELRFYKAINPGGDYTDGGIDWATSYCDEEGHAYEFEHPYDGIPSQRLYKYDDIKPTIVGVENTELQPFGEIAAVAFDDNDNDQTELGNAEDKSAKYKHGYFYIKLHRLNYVDVEGTDWGLNLFKMASQEDAMTICMTSGRTAGCKFKVQALEGTGESAGLWLNPVQVTAQGNIVAGDYNAKVAKKADPRNQDSSECEIWIAVQKDTETYGVIMPNRENNFLPEAGDKFNIVNIRLPKCYVLAAEKRLEAAMMSDMHKDNSERWTMEPVLSKIWCVESREDAYAIDEYSIVDVRHGNEVRRQYVTSVTIDCKDSEPLPEVKIDLSDEIEGIGEGLASRILGEVLTSVQNSNDTASARPHSWLLEEDTTTENEPTDIGEVLANVKASGVGGDNTMEVLNDGVVTTGAFRAPNLRGGIIADSITLGSGSAVVVRSGDAHGIVLPELGGKVRTVEAWHVVTSRSGDCEVVYIPESENVRIGVDIGYIGDVTAGSVKVRTMGSYRLQGIKEGGMTYWNVQLSLNDHAHKHWEQTTDEPDYIRGLDEEE